MDECITLTQVELKDLLLQAIKEGFDHSGEGCNGEYNDGDISEKYWEKILENMNVPQLQ